MRTSHESSGREDKKGESKGLQKMHILMISHTAEQTGAPLSFLALARQIAQQGQHETRILLRRSGPLLKDMQAASPTQVFRTP